MTTQAIRVSQSTDDSEQFTTGSGGNVSSSALNIGQQDWVGLRFQGLNAPNAATITDAKITWTAFGSDSNDVDVIVSAQDADSAGTFSTATNDISTRTLTTANVSVSLTSSEAWTGGTEYEFTGLASVVQEVVNRAGWSAGNNIVLIVQDDGSSSQRRAESYDNSSSEAPLLTVTWTDPDVTLATNLATPTLTTNQATITPGAASLATNLATPTLTTYQATFTENISFETVTKAPTLTTYQATITPGATTLATNLKALTVSQQQAAITYNLQHEYPTAIVGGGAVVNIFAS